MHRSKSRYQRDDDDDEETQGRYASPPHMAEELPPREKKGKNYAEKYLAEERAALRWAYRLDNNDFSELEEIETSSVISDRDDGDVGRQRIRALREEILGANSEPRSNLVIDDFKMELLHVVEMHEVVVLTGPTGCGKSTQVPQYLLEESIKKLEPCNIVATQPRRVAAIGIARRICESREWELGKLCGFKVGLKDRTSPETMLTFMTTGVLLQTLISKRSLSQFTHIILDEVHERDQSMDFLLIVIKKLLYENPDNKTKIILMSATVDTEKFASYFPRIGNNNKTVPCPILTINRPTNYKVDIYYLDHLAEFGPFPHIGLRDPVISKQSYQLCVKLLKEFEKFEQDLKNKNSVLVFLPGIYEIEQLYYKLNNIITQPNGEYQYKWSVLPLHSSITTEEQILVFLPPKPGYRKIILSTNIAESSITVPGVKYVIDFCLMKRMKNDPSTNFSGLQLCWASQVNCIQRAGRVGRLMDGKVYRLIYEQFYTELYPESKPEMLDAPLDRIVLQAKMLDMSEPKALLALALDPPDISDIEWTILTLKEAGALLRRREGVYTPFDGDITFLGRLMAILPVDIYITKLIAMGYIFGCLTDCIIMGAAMSIKNVFSYPFRDRLKAYEFKYIWAENSFSDSIALLNVYNVWKSHCEKGYFERSVGETEIEWANRNFIRLRVLKEIKILVEEIKFRLKEYNVEDLGGKGNTFNNNFERNLFLKVAIAGAFYPHYYCPGYRYGESCEEEAVKELGELNPLTTVVLHNFPSDQPMELYFNLMQNYLSDWDAEMRFHPKGCSKILVEFRQSQVRTKSRNENILDVIRPTKVPMAVYRAIKFRRLNRSIDIKLLPTREAKVKAEKIGLVCLDEKPHGNREKFENFPPCPLPAANVALVNIVIIHIINPGHFWALYATTLPHQEMILSAIEEHFSTCEPFENIPIPGEMCIAPLCKRVETRYYRARIESVVEGLRPSAKVFFVDQGCYSDVDIADLRQYGPDLAEDLREFPGQAFECVLSGIRPSPVLNGEGVWTETALHFFKKLIRRGKLYGQIYSIVRGVVHMELHTIGYEYGSNVNEMLIDKKFAERAEESHLSRVNYGVRADARRNDYKKALKYYEKTQFWAAGTPQADIKEKDLTVNAHLKGPTSPLEMTLYPCTRGTLSQCVIISEDSVNSVLLNTEPGTRFDRLVVAGIVNHNVDATKLIINQTTVMPNLPALPALIHLMFSPEVELRLNKDGTKYTGILCGLGIDRKGRALFPEHDIEIHFDSEITYRDFILVNQMRSLMSLLLKVSEQKHYLTRSGVIAYQKKIRSIALKLFTKERTPIESDPVLRNHDWRKIAPFVPCRGYNSNYYTYPPHPIMGLKRKPRD